MKKKVIIVGIVIVIIVAILVLPHDAEKNNKTKSSDSGLAIMVQNASGEYEKYEKETWPSAGYIYNHEKSKCNNEVDNGTTDPLYWDEAEETFILSNAKSTNCTVYFDKTEKVTKALDLSGNGYDGEFKGAVIQKDGDNGYGLYFDGVDDYVDIDDLPASIRWTEGFSYEFEVKWERFTNYARLLDFSMSYSNNIIFFSAEASGRYIGAYPSVYFTDSQGTPKTNQLSTGKYSLNTNQKYKIKVEYTKDSNQYTEAVYVDNDKKSEVSYPLATFIKDVTRNTNYLGTYGPTTGSTNFFKGYIYNIKFTDASGKPILWYKFNK